MKTPALQNENTDTGPQHNKMKWVACTYISKETPTMTAFLKHANENRIPNAEHIQNLIKQHPQRDKYGSGLY
jgi:hypothetical protein